MMEHDIPCSTNPKKDGISILIPGKIGFRIRSIIIKSKKRRSHQIKGLNH